MGLDLSKWGLPPIEKIHEALSAVADNRLEFFDNYALVSSSNYKKKYTVEWDSNIYTSNDNASYWQGYLGYSVIAVLMAQKKISYDETIANYFKGIDWKSLNSKAKNNYSKVAESILADLASNGANIDEINKYVEKVYEEIKTLDIFYKRSKLMPPR